PFPGLADGFRPLPVAVLAAPLSSSSSSISSYWSLRPHFLYQLLRSLKNDASTSIRTSCLWGLFILIHQEIINQQQVIDNNEKEKEKLKKVNNSSGNTNSNTNTNTNTNINTSTNTNTSTTLSKDKTDIISRALLAIFTACRPMAAM